MTIHKEGKTIILFTTLLVMLIALIVNLFSWQQTEWHIVLYVFLAVILFLIVRFFRVPNRTTKPAHNKVVSVCDGTVVNIEEVYEKEYFKDKRLLVSIFMSIHNVHVNWYPVSGIVRYVKYHAGKKFIAKHPKSSEENERTTVVVKTESDKEVLFRQIAGIVARRVVYYSCEGDAVKQGDEMGVIKFGSRIDHYLPLNANIKVTLKQKVKGKMTVLAEI
ncbi:MAG: phosphatidylserine decarboxylase family protein [Bacteroidales bacterium]|nr:phosphatidylserine decarboxylase family protein [Bacteroidales bacterium]